MLSNDGRGLCPTKPDTGPFTVYQMDPAFQMKYVPDY